LQTRRHLLDAATGSKVRIVESRGFLADGARPDMQMEAVAPMPSGGIDIA
jgi:hypothetical protein